MLTAWSRRLLVRASGQEVSLQGQGISVVNLPTSNDGRQMSALMLGTATAGVSGF